jgi:hypothetical protein
VQRRERSARRNECIVWMRAEIGAELESRGEHEREEHM